MKPSSNDLANAKLAGQEMERMRLASDIHDELGPLISTLKLRIEQMKDELEDESGRLSDGLADFRGLVDHLGKAVTPDCA